MPVKALCQSKREASPGRLKPGVCCDILLLVAEEQRGTDSAVRERVKPKKKDPTLYKVVLLNDDYTTMEFVIHVLETVFQQSPAEAYRVMMHVHVNGRGIAGVYPWEVAETKAATVMSLAREAGFPLRAALEEG